MRSIFGLLCSALLLTAAIGCSKSSSAGSGGGGGASIEGTYLLQTMESGSFKLNDEIAKMPEENRTVTIKGDKLTMNMGMKAETSTIKIDSSKSPAEMDVTETKSDGKTETTHVIYKLEGDVLTICGPDTKGSSKPEDRPKEFKSGEKTMIMTMKKK
jgi:uncharacterized protein (TIGR03067 family)